MGITVIESAGKMFALTDNKCLTDMLSRVRCLGLFDSPGCPIIAPGHPALVRVVSIRLDFKACDRCQQRNESCTATTNGNYNRRRPLINATAHY